MECFTKRQNTGRVAIILSGFTFLFQSCGPYDEYQSERQEVRCARNQLQIAQEFHSLFPDSVSRKAEGKYGQALTMETALYDLYVLTLFVKYSIDQKGTIVGSSDPPKLILREITRISSDYVEFDPATEVTLGPAEWNRFITSNGNPAEFQVQIKTNSPIPGFKDWWRSKKGDFRL